MVAGGEMIIPCCRKEHSKKNDDALHIPGELERVHVDMGEALLRKGALFFCGFIYSFTQQIFLKNLLYATHWRIRKSVVKGVVKVPTLTKPTVL